MIVFIVFLIVIGVVYYFYQQSELSDPAYVKVQYKNRSEEQKKVIRYFAVGDGCFKKTISDQDYDNLVKACLAKEDFKQKAINKIGLDESELQEIEPVHFEGWTYGKDNGVTYSKRGKDGNWRSSAYQTSWLFFSSTQVYLYQNTIHFDKDNKKVATEEYFYKDITNFSTSSDTIETPYWDIKERKNLLENVDTNRFALTVPGDKFYCSMEQNDYTERAIQGMKAKLREKKS
jgi:hypothetical protein